MNLNVPYVPLLDIPLILGLLDAFGAVIALGSDIWFTNMDIDVMSLVKPDAAMTMGQDPCADIPGKWGPCDIPEHSENQISAGKDRPNTAIRTTAVRLAGCS